MWKKTVGRIKIKASVYHHLSLTVKIMKVKITTQSSWKSHLSRIICKCILNLSTSSASNASNMEYRTISNSSDGISPGSWSNFFHKLAFFLYCWNEGVGGSARPDSVASSFSLLWILGLANPQCLCHLTPQHRNSKCPSLVSPAMIISVS